MGQTQGQVPHRCAQLVVDHRQVVLQPVDIPVLQQTVARCSQLLVDVVQVLLGQLGLLCCGTAPQVGADPLNEDPEQHTHTDTLSPDSVRAVRGGHISRRCIWRIYIVLFLNRK